MQTDIQLFERIQKIKNASWEEIPNSQSILKACLKEHSIALFPELFITEMKTRFIYNDYWIQLEQFLTTQNSKEFELFAKKFSRAFQNLLSEKKNCLHFVPKHLFDYSHEVSKMKLFLLTHINK